jgi:uncharacterized protein (TIRG00374 family)
MGKGIKKKTKRILIISLSIGLGIILILGLLRLAGFRQFFDILSNISPLVIIFALIIYSFSWLFRAIRLRLLVNRAGQPFSLFVLGKIRIAGFALNTLFPAKLGEMATIAFLRMEGIKTGPALAIVFLERIMDVSGLVLLSAPALILSLQGKLPEWVIVVLIFGLFVVLASFALIILDKNRIILNFLNFLCLKFSYKILRGVVLKLKEAYESYLSLASDGRLIPPLVFYSVIIWLLEGMVCFMICLGVGEKISLLAVLLSVAIANAGKAVPITPGALGIYESLLSVMLVLFGSPVEVAITIAILEQGVKKSFNLLLGIPTTVKMGLSFPKLFEIQTQKEIDETL